MGYAKIAGMPVVAGSIDDIDHTGWKTLEELRADLADRKVRLVLADASDPVKAELDRYGLTQELGADAFYPSVADVIDARATPAP